MRNECTVWDPYAEFEQTTLPNGLTVHAAHWPGRPWEAMGFLIHSGAQHDPVGLEGLAHFVEHVVSHNVGIPAEEMHVFFEDCGGTADLGATNYPFTCYSFFAPTDTTVLKKALSMFGGMLLNARLQDSIEREREVIIGEFRRDYPFQFRFDVDMHERKVLYAGHWLERFVCPLGNPESIKRITQDALQSYYDTHYTPANMSVVAVGGIRPSKLVQLLSKSPFATSKKGTRTALPTPATDVALPSETRHVLELSRHFVAPVDVGAYRSVAKIPGEVKPQTVLIMTGMLREILNKEVRERRAWAYAISTAFHNFGSLYELSIGCDALALRAIEEIEKVVDDCIASLGDREDLFARIKHRAFTKTSMIDVTGRGVCDAAMMDLAYDQRIISLTENGDDLERTTMGDVRNLLPWLRSERRWTLVTRP